MGVPLRNKQLRAEGRACRGGGTEPGGGGGGEAFTHRLATVSRSGAPEPVGAWLLPLLHSIGFCVAHRDETRDAALVIRVRSAAPEANALPPLPPDTASLPDAVFSPDAVIIDFLMDSVVARRDSAAEARVRNATSANRVHLNYFCTPPTPAHVAYGQPHPLFVMLLDPNATRVEPRCVVATEYMEALLKLAIAYLYHANVVPGLAGSARVVLSPSCAGAPPRCGEEARFNRGETSAKHAALSQPSRQRSVASRGERRRPPA